MSGDTDLRLKEQIYNLLYACPLTDFASGGTIRTAVIGGASAAIEAFKAVYSCGQAFFQDGGTIRACRLVIDIFAPAPSGFDAGYLQEHMPGLAAFPGYAEITFHTGGPGPLDGYVVLLCDGDAEVPGDPALTAKWTDAGFLVRTGDGYTALPPSVRRDILRMARNMQYTYNLVADPCARYSSTADEGTYASDSSSASIAHLPCSLALLDRDRTRAVEKLTEILSLPDGEREKDRRYQALIRLEHRRWNAYMAANGFREPSLEEFYAYAYTVSADHRYLEKGLHPCICEGGGDPFYLQRHPALWEADGFETDPALSALDRLSIRCYRRCRERAEEVLPELKKLLGRLKVQTVENRAASRFCAAAEKAASSASFSLYDECRQKLPEAFCAAHGEELARVDRCLEYFRRVRERKDFALLDVHLIHAIPFLLWHGVLYRTVITVCGGQPVENVALPYLLTCEKAVFLCGGSTDEEKIRKFFASWAGDTEAEFVHTDLSDISAIEAAVAACIPEDVRQDEIALNCPGTGTGAALIAMGRICGKDERIALLRYDGAVVDCKTNRAVSCAVSKSIRVDAYLRLMSAEYENVYDGIDMLTDEKYEDLVDIFRDHSQIRSYCKDKRGKTYAAEYCTWSSLSDFFGSISKNTDWRDFIGAGLLEELQEEDRRSGECVSELRIDRTVYENFEIGFLLRRMRHYRLIDFSDGDIRSEDGAVSVSFRTPDPATRYIFRGVSRWTAGESPTRKRIAVSGGIQEKEPICTLDIRVPRSTLLKPDDKEIVKQEKLKLLEALYDKGIISDLDSGGILTQRLAPRGDPANLREVAQCSFVFSSVQVKRLFQKSGQLFELILYNKLRAYQDLFSDVQMGVKIAWSDDRSWDYYDRLKGYFRENAGVGKAYFRKAREAVRASSGCCTENEIDVVLMSALRATFISCKTGKAIENNWLYEIASISGHFCAQPVLAVSFDLEEQLESCASYMKRAKRMQISLFGSETVYNEQRLRAAMEKIARGEVVSVLPEI